MIPTRTDPHPGLMRICGRRRAAMAVACALPGEKPNVADVALARRETGMEYFGSAHAAP